MHRLPAYSLTQLFTREMVNPNYALFTVSAVDDYTYRINPLSAINPEHLFYFRSDPHPPDLHADTTTTTSPHSRTACQCHSGSIVTLPSLRAHTP